jgi:hypothetical protein
MLRYEASAMVQAPVERVFAHVDDPARLSAHMSESSWMMAGSRMRVETDAGRGQAIGSRIRLCGRILGFKLFVEELVVERRPPHGKSWETSGTPKLIVIGHYRMGFELTPQDGACRLRVFIDYSIPPGPPGSWLGRLLGSCYARWCVQRMISDAVRHFAAPAAEQTYH